MTGVYRAHILLFFCGLIGMHAVVFAEPSFDEIDTAIAAADYDRARRDTLDAIQAIQEAALRCQAPAEAAPAVEEN